MVPASAALMSMSVLSMLRTRSDSSMQSASASRAAPGSAAGCMASSAVPRIRVSGVRRSWATLSNDSRMARINDSFFSSKVLKMRTSSSNSSRDLRVGTRASSLPVRRISWAVVTI